MAKATLFLDAVLCKDEMGGSWRERFGNDEIYIGAIGINGWGEAVKVPFSEVYAHFDDGDRKLYSPAKPLVSLDTSSAGGNCHVILLLAEKQHGGMNDALNLAFTQASVRLAKAKADGNGPRSDANEEDSTWVTVLIECGKIAWHWLNKESKDKVMPAQVVGLAPNPGAVEFRGHDGIYGVRYHWGVV